MIISMSCNEVAASKIICNLIELPARWRHLPFGNIVAVFLGTSTFENIWERGSIHWLDSEFRITLEQSEMKINPYKCHTYYKIVIGLTTNLGFGMQFELWRVTQ